jgi:hypothetical protein
MTRRTMTGAVCSLLATMVSGAAPAWSQERVGVVTAVVGPVTLARTSMPLQALKFKDDVFVDDRITTGEDAITRILLGGKVVVTARERSTLTITEVPGLSTIDLTSGRIAVAVDKTRMKPGERVDVRTPNAIAGVRGTVLIVEALRDTSTVTVLRGLVDVARLDPLTGRPVGAITPVGALQAVSVRNNVLPARPQTISRDRSQALSSEFTPPLKSVPSADVMPVNDELKRASDLLSTALPRPGASAEKLTPTAGGAKERKEDSAAAASSTLLTLPTLTTAPARTNSPNLGSSLLNTSSAKRLLTTPTP